MTPCRPVDGGGSLRSHCLYRSTKSRIRSAEDCRYMTELERASAPTIGNGPSFPTRKTPPALRTTRQVDSKFLIGSIPRLSYTPPSTSLGGYPTSHGYLCPFRSKGAKHRVLLRKRLRLPQRVVSPWVLQIQGCNRRRCTV